MKKIALIGGSGDIGGMLQKGMRDDFDIYNLDINIDDPNEKNVPTDVLNYDQLLANIPDNTDVLVNLVFAPLDGKLVDIPEMDHMVDIFFKASYHIFQAAVELNIPKVIFTSSNHVTDHYESNGDSTLGREITIKDYPYSNGLYGVMKLASENIGFAFHQAYDVSVINLRIGSAKQQEKKAIYKNYERLKKTWLSEADTVQLYRKSILTDVRFGTYYGVSDNPGKPWSTENAKEELGFVSIENTVDITQKRETR